MLCFGSFQEGDETSSTTFLVIPLMFFILCNSKFDYDCWCVLYTLQWYSLLKLMPKRETSNGGWKRKQTAQAEMILVSSVRHIPRRVDIFAFAWCEKFLMERFMICSSFFFFALSSFVAWALSASSSRCSFLWPLIKRPNWVTFGSKSPRST